MPPRPGIIRCAAAMIGALFMAPGTPIADGPGTNQLAQTAGAAQRAARAYGAKEFQRARVLARIALRSQSSVPLAYIILGWSEFQLGRYDRAAATFASMLRRFPRSTDGLIGLGFAMLKLGRLKEANTHFSRAGRDAIADQRYLVADGKGWVAFTERRYADAKRHFNSFPEERAKARFPQDRELGNGWIALAEGKLDQAADWFRRGLKLRPGYFRLYDGLGRVALFRGRQSDAVRFALRALKEVKFNREAFHLLDAALYRTRNVGSALATYRSLIRKHRDIPDYYAAAGWHALNAGQLAAAHRYFLVALQIRWALPLGRAGLKAVRLRMSEGMTTAWKEYSRGNYARALHQFNRQIARQGARNAAVQTGRGWALLGLGRIPEAGQAFRAALRVDRFYALAKKGLQAQQQGFMTTYFLGWDIAATGQFAKARKQFSRAAAIMPRRERWRVQVALAWLDLFQNKPDRALAAFRVVLQQQPQSPLALRGLAVSATLAGNNARAGALLRQAARSTVSRFVASFTAPAVAFLAMNRPQEAKAILLAGRAADPKNPSVAFHLARTHARLGEHKDALRLAILAARRAPRWTRKHAASLRLPRQARARFLLVLAHSLFRAWDNEAAEATFSEAISAGAGMLAVRGRGFTRYRLGRYTTAIEDLSRAAALEPARLPIVKGVVPMPGTGLWWPIRYNARSTLAWAYFREGDNRMAARLFRRTLKSYPASIDALSGLGWALLGSGDTAGAAVYFRAALLLSPGFPDAWRGLDRTRGKSPRR